MNWFYANAGQQAGPVNDEEFNRLIGAGAIQPSTLVWHEGMANWEPLSKVRTATGAPPPAAFIPPLEQAAPPPGQVICNECQKAVPAEETMQFGTATICAACKPIYVQKLREGAAPNYALAQGQFRYGGFWIRVAAKLIDSIIIGIPIGLLYLAGMFLFGFGATIGGAGGGQPNMPALMGMFGMQLGVQFLAVLLGGFYNVFFVVKYGATPGKMAVGLRIVMPDGGKILLGRAIGRYFGEMVSGLVCYIGYIIAAFDDQKRCLHDHMCNTRVVYK